MSISGDGYMANKTCDMENNIQYAVHYSLMSTS